MLLVDLFVIAALAINFFRPFRSIWRFKFIRAFCVMAMLWPVAHAGTTPKPARGPQVKPPLVPAIRTFARQRYALLPIKQKLVFGNVVIFRALGAGKNLVQV